jgi:GT2 family glycosyltransferase
VTVVVAVRDGEATLDACLESLRRLDYPTELCEVLVVDNASTDRTPEILERHRDWIRVERESVRGVSAARNRGIRMAAHGVIAFTDADCEVDPGWLRALVRPLEDPSVGIAGGLILAFESDGAVARYGERIHDHRLAIEVYSPPYVISMNWASPREVLERVGAFDVDILRVEDVDLAFRILRAGYHLVFVPEAIIRHHNETTLRGLFHEGFVHGSNGVRILKLHRGLVKESGHRRFDLRSWGALARRCARALAHREDIELTCQTVFELGKKLGKLAGSVRYGHVEL